MPLGMQGSALSLSELLNPTPKGTHRVGAQGPQLHELDARTLKALLPLALEKFQKRQEEKAFQQQLMQLPEDQRESAWQAKYHPKLFGAQQAASRQQAAQRAGIEKEVRAGLAEAAKNEREVGEKMDAEDRLTERTVNLRNEARDYSDAEKAKDIARLKSAFGDVGPEIGEMAGAVGMQLPPGKLRYLATEDQKKKWAEMTGDPSMDIVTDKQLGPIRDAYSQFDAMKSMIPQVQNPNAQQMPPNQYVADEDGPRATPPPQLMYGPDNMLDDQAKIDDFQKRVKLWKGDVGKAWSEIREDKKQADSSQKEAHREVRANDKEGRSVDRAEKNLMRASEDKLRLSIGEALSKVTKAEAEVAAAKARATNNKFDLEAGKAIAAAEGELAGAQSLYDSLSNHYGEAFSKPLPNYLKRGGKAAEPAKPAAAPPAPLAPDHAAVVVQNPRVKELMAKNEAEGLDDTEYAELLKLTGR